MPFGRLSPSGDLRFASISLPRLSMLTLVCAVYPFRVFAVLRLHPPHRKAGDRAGSAAEERSHPAGGVPQRQGEDARARGEIPKFKILGPREQEANSSPGTDSLSVFRQPQSHGRLHKRLDRWKASTEDQLPQGRLAMLFQEPADECVHERTVSHSYPGKIEHEALAGIEREIWVDARHPESVGFGSVAEVGAEFLLKVDFVSHGSKLTGETLGRKGISRSLSLLNI